MLRFVPGSVTIIRFYDLSGGHNQATLRTLGSSSLSDHYLDMKLFLCIQRSAFEEEEPYDLL